MNNGIYDLRITESIIGLPEVGVLTRIFENFDFLRSSESTFFFSNPYKTPEMNELDIELSKKSKIIEIGSVEKSYGSSKLVGFRKNPEISGFSYN